MLGCTYYVVVAWVWSLIWHLGLDPLKVGAVLWSLCAVLCTMSPNVLHRAAHETVPTSLVSSLCTLHLLVLCCNAYRRRHPCTPLQWFMLYIMDEEGFRTGGGMFANVFRTRGEHMGAAANIGINKVGG